MPRRRALFRRSGRPSEFHGDIVRLTSLSLPQSEKQPIPVHKSSHNRFVCQQLSLHRSVLHHRVVRLKISGGSTRNYCTE